MGKRKSGRLELDLVKKIGLISDTHGRLRNEVFPAFADVDLILHAGDIGSIDIITQLETLAPVHAVHGNTDGFDVRRIYPETIEVDVAGKRIGVTHGHVLGSPTPAGLREMLPNCEVIVYGHTHKPLLDRAGPIIINPGAAGPARFQLKPSVAVLRVPSLEIEFIEL